ncbi:uncharacterized protein N7498_000504 [Penicillium cinerascens]|uniref:Uncharacterized protein n=1 Tax=Penicillium cinerascens TaxID=70096 RepID=A0A9W9TEA3_9EURO|nr:uncharacterized protein N7498_000504 [Penicillium cinerascens]KAJ5218405.1 hypothetical protein N7498_000504 [Penicillium cinerascens]
MGGLPLWRSPLSKSSDRRGQAVEGVADVTTQDETLFENPQFEHYEATSNIQLFFDLFFVANLTSFTNAHEINSSQKMGSYIGFFCILWFTWAQVTLYDVRFATDSVLESVAHTCHSGVMVGLAIIGPEFLTEDDGWGPPQQLSLILMASRVVLFCQYGSTLFFTWRYRATRLPLMGVMVSLFIAAIIYLGVSFAFYRTASNAYIAWYVVAVIEVGVNLALAARWKAISFEKTHLVERLTCLTLIILGEGIIGLTKTIVKIETFDLKFTSADIGSVISAVLVIKGGSTEGLLTTLNDTVHTIYERFPSTQNVFDEVEASLDAVMNHAANTTDEEIMENVQLVFRQMTKTIIEGFGWEPPTEIADEDFTAYGSSIVSIFNLTFGYFCVCTGLVCLIIGVLTLLSHRYRSGHSSLRYISIGANILVGLGIALLSTAVLTDAAGNLGTTPWTLPALTLILLALILLHHLSVAPPKPESKDN